jgi:hypothetical protein
VLHIHAGGSKPPRNLYGTAVHSAGLGLGGRRKVPIFLRTGGNNHISYSTVYEMLARITCNLLRAICHSESQTHLDPTFRNKDIVITPSLESAKIGTYISVL